MKNTKKQEARKAQKTVEINGKTYKMRRSVFTLNESPVHVSDGMSGKMQGIPSISTASLLNKFCRARMENGDSVCAHCFAERAQKQYGALFECLMSNYHLLTESILPVEMLPKFGNVRIVRIESFGDVENEIQAINYLNIVKSNKRVTFAWWSKNMKIIERAIEATGGKPSNLILVESSEKLNTQKQISSVYVDKVFTVYDKKHIKENGIRINCGARDCLSCGRCYSKKTGPVVNEQLK